MAVGCLIAAGVTRLVDGGGWYAAQLPVTGALVLALGGAVAGLFGGRIGQGLAVGGVVSTPFAAAVAADLVGIAWTGLTSVHSLAWVAGGLLVASCAVGLGAVLGSGGPGLGWLGTGVLALPLVAVLASGAAVGLANAPWWALLLGGLAGLTLGLIAFLGALEVRGIALLWASLLVALAGFSVALADSWGRGLIVVGVAVLCALAGLVGELSLARARQRLLAATDTPLARPLQRADAAPLAVGALAMLLVAGLFAGVGVWTAPDQPAAAADAVTSEQPDDASAGEDAPDGDPAAPASGRDGGDSVWTSDNGYYCAVNEVGVNMRTGPGTEYAELVRVPFADCTIEEGDSPPEVQFSSSGRPWRSVVWNGQTGYMSDLFLRPSAWFDAYAATSGPDTDPGQPVLGNAWSDPAASGFGETKPETVYLGGVSSGMVTEIAWTTWGGEVAEGVGSGWYVPEGALQAETYAAPAVIVLSDLGTCDGVLAYRSYGWYFPTWGETPQDLWTQSACE